MGWGGTGQLKCGDAELSPTISSRAAGEGGIRWLASAGLTQPIPCQVLPRYGGARTIKGLGEACRRATGAEGTGCWLQA